MMAVPSSRTTLQTIETMWRREVEAAATYRHLAARERDPKRADDLGRLLSNVDAALASRGDFPRSEFLPTMQRLAGFL